MDWIIPLSILSSYILGALGYSLYSWLASGEGFNGRKFAASTIMMTVFALAEGLGMLTSNMMLDTIALIIFCGQGFLSGFGIVAGTSKVVKARNG